MNLATICFVDITGFKTVVSVIIRFFFRSILSLNQQSLYIIICVLLKVILNMKNIFSTLHGFNLSVVLHENGIL